MASASLVLADSTSVLASSGEEVVDLLKGGQGVLNIVPLHGVVKELDAAILELSKMERAQPDRAQPDRARGVAKAAQGG